MGKEIPSEECWSPDSIFTPSLSYRSLFQFRVWPRDPDGQEITCLPKGKFAPNGTHIWGASREDFWAIQRIPGFPCLITISTSSALAQWMKQTGEQIAKTEIDWAANEEMPELQTHHAPTMRKDSMEFVPMLCGSHILPKMLVIHDPYGLLNGRDPAIYNSLSIGPDEDRTYRYGLIEHLALPAPSQPQTLAHVYLSPSRCLGKGNHSVVYDADCEMPAYVLGHCSLCKATSSPTSNAVAACHHLRRFRIAAKISKSNTAGTGPIDPLLSREAANYAQFSKRLFESWSGYNIVPPSSVPTPLRAVVPNFYGLYRPQCRSSNSYQSDIILLEHCGIPIDPGSLSRYEKEECAALLLRFHYFGWVHGSFFERNIMMDSDRRFRLIDFGRSRMKMRGPVARGNKENDEDDFARLLYGERNTVSEMLALGWAY